MNETASGGRNPRTAGSRDVTSLRIAQRLTWATFLVMFLTLGIAIVGVVLSGGDPDDAGPDGRLAAEAFAVLVALVALTWGAWGLTRARSGACTTTVVVLAGWALFTMGAYNEPYMRWFPFLNWALTLPAIGLLLRRGTREAYRQGAAGGPPMDLTATGPPAPPGWIRTPTPVDSPPVDNAHPVRPGTPPATFTDVFSLGFARFLAWINCVFMLAICMVALTSDSAPGRVNAFARSHPDAMAAIGVAILAAVGVVIWAGLGVTRCRKGSWTTLVTVLAAWSLFVSPALRDGSLRPGVLINWAVTLPAVGLLLRPGTREAYRQGAARGMPVV